MLGWARNIGHRGEEVGALVDTRPTNPRGHGARLRDELLQAATRLLERDGRDAVLTLRAVAREAGVAAPSVYPHFSDLDALVLAVIEQHLRGLGSSVRRAAARAGDDPVARVRAAAHAYVRWGLVHPGPYTVVFEGRALRQLTADQERAMTADSGLMDAVAGLVAALPDPPADPHLRAVALWTALHGVVSLRLSKPAFEWPGVQRHVDAVIAMHLPAA
ncbi:MAG: TetR/AcrR family transcriptional regulator [Angustibacter sp.]